MAHTTQLLPLTLMLPVEAIGAYALAALDGSGASLSDRLSHAIARMGRQAHSHPSSLAKLRLASMNHSGPAIAFRLMLPASVVSTLLTLSAAADLGLSDLAATWLVQSQKQPSKFRRLGAGQGHGRMAAYPSRP